MTFERSYHNLHAVLTRDQGGRIVKADLTQPQMIKIQGADKLQLDRSQLYALVDWVAVADPEEWGRRFPHQETAELALRRVADYFRERAKSNRRVGSSPTNQAMANTFDLAVTRVMEEIEALYEDEGMDAITAIQNYHTRRRA